MLVASGSTILLKLIFIYVVTMLVNLWCYHEYGQDFPDLQDWTTENIYRKIIFFWMIPVWLIGAMGAILLGISICVIIIGAPLLALAWIVEFITKF